MKHATELEVKLLTTIATDDYTPLNGAVPDMVDDASTFVGVQEFAQALNITINQLKGVLGSLVKKGFVGVEEGLGEELDAVWLTDTGFEIYRSTIAV